MKKDFKIMLLIESLIIVLLVALYFFVNSKYVNLVPQCYIYNATAWYCPSCGGTRCIIALLNFEFIKAFCYHPIFFVSIVLGVIVNFYYIICVLLNKKFKIFKWWYAIVWGIILLLYTLIRNIY